MVLFLAPTLSWPLGRVMYYNKKAGLTPKVNELKVHKKAFA